MIASLLRVSKKELEAYQKDSTLLENRLVDDESEDDCLLDIGKSWDGIVFLLTGESARQDSDELTKILFSGAFVDEKQDFGYGPAHYLLPEEVKELHEQIAKISSEQLQKHFNPKKMMADEIYPPIWEVEEDAFGFLKEAFDELCAFYKQAAKSQQAVIVVIS